MPASLSPYLTAMAPLTQRLQSKHGADWGWTRGGCFAFAEVYAELFGAEQWGLCRRDRDAGDYPVDHAVLRVKMSDGSVVFFDAQGLVVEPKRGSRTKLLRKDDPRVAWFLDDFLDDDDWRDLHAILRSTGPWPGSIVPVRKRSRRSHGPRA